MFEKGWWDQIEPFVADGRMYQIVKAVGDAKKEGVEIIPKWDDVFRAFKECSWSNLNTVILGMD